MLKNYCKITFIALLGLSMVASSCSLFKKQAAVQEKEQDYFAEGYVLATVKDSRGLDGCQFLLELASGNRLEPSGLPENFKKNGLEVYVKYKLRKGVSSICMSGLMVEIIDIKLKG